MEVYKKRVSPKTSKQLLYLRLLTGKLAQKSLLGKK